MVMRPEGVDAGLVEKGVAALYTDSFAEWQALPSIHRKLAMEKHATNVTVALAAVLPDHRKQVIEEVATAIERSDSRRFPGRGWDYQYAAALRNYAHEEE